MKHQRAAAIATWCRRLGWRAQRDDRRNFAKARIVVDQRRIAVLVRDEEIAGLVAQELRLLAA
jgi:hypothetical protein